MITSPDHHKILDLIAQAAPSWRLANVLPLQHDDLYLSYWINLVEDCPGVEMTVSKFGVLLHVRQNWHSVFVHEDFLEEERWPALKSFLKTCYRFTINMK